MSDIFIDDGFIKTIDEGFIKTNKLYIPKVKSIIHFGEMTTYSVKKFTRLQKHMLKVFFGFEIEDLS